MHRWRRILIVVAKLAGLGLLLLLAAFVLFIVWMLLWLGGVRAVPGMARQLTRFARSA